jgi:hypothetical protein
MNSNIVTAGLSATTASGTRGACFVIGLDLRVVAVATSFVLLGCRQGTKSGNLPSWLCCPAF